MKKVIGIALVLAVMVTLCFSTIALADPGDTEVVVNFNGDDPDVTVTAFVPNTGYYTIDALAQFTLTGTSHAVGSITASLVPGSMWTSVSGGYSATEGDFSSSFIAEGLLNDPWYPGQVWHSEHSINATGVTDGSLNVLGYAEAGYPGGSYGCYHCLGAGQLFGGEGSSATITGERWHSADVNLLDAYAFFTADVTGSSTVQFCGYTDGSYYETDYDGNLVRALERYIGGESINAFSGWNGLGFGVDIDGSDLDGTLETTYPYTSVMAFDQYGNSIDTEITHNGWAMIEAFNADQLFGSSATWDGYPGYTGPEPAP